MRVRWWRFSALVRTGETEISKRINWKLANDTFGETYHFQKLHRNTLGQLFYGDNLSYETFGRNHRFVFASRICHYFTEQALQADQEAIATGNALTLDEVYDFEVRKNKVPNLTVVNAVFDSTIEQEDYHMCELIQRSAESGILEQVVFGRNEPALHHYHNSYRAALGLEPLQEYRDDR